MSNSSGNQESIFSIMQTAATLRSHGVSDKEIRRRLVEIGLQPDTAAGAIHGLPAFVQKTGGAGRVAGPPKVFISHSHSDRKTASYLQKILDQNQARTYLDQHAIVPGQDLKARLTLGLVWCDQLLLLWSQYAAQSTFVRWEWQRAQMLMKGLLPYALDGTPLPGELEGLVYIDRSDQKHGHADLLRTILGRQWKPDTGTPFPGLWRAELSFGGLGEAEYELELRANGQIIGHGRIKEAGLMGGLAQSLGVSGVLSMEIPLSGTWSYDDAEKILELDITGTLMGQANRDVVRIHATGKEAGWLQGQTLGGLPWRLRRLH
jgi:hypothetical protein